MKRFVPLLVALSACTTFEDPDIVLDFRVLAMRADIPEQVIDIDINNPPEPIDVLDQLVDTRVCVLLSDRNFDRQLHWKMTLCNMNSIERCNDGDPHADLGAGIWDDPDLAATAPELCAPIPANGNLIGVAYDYLKSDQLKGLGGIYYGVSLRVGGVGADPDFDLFAAKSLRIMPRIPADLRANNNPFLDHLEAIIEGTDVAMTLPLGRCADQASPVVLAPDQHIRITPIEPDGVREDYVVPTIDGLERMFTESLTYQWLATAGSFSSGSTGGPRDTFGNPPPLFSDWHSPKAKDLEGPLDVDLWIVQRDERLGVAWVQTCVRVMP